MIVRSVRPRTNSIRTLALAAAVLALAAGCGGAPTDDAASAVDPAPPSAVPLAFDDVAALREVEPEPGEAHFGRIKMLTDGGENAEAYFSPDGRQLILQITDPDAGIPCDQIFRLDLATGEKTLVSTGRGRTTCAYFLPDGRRVLYASTHAASDECPPPPDRSRGYVWPIYASYDIYVADGEALRPLTDVDGYDAEATVSPRGDRIVFTSTRDGDLDLYAMNLDGSGVVRLTDRLGYDGGAFYSPDGQRIVWRAHYPETEDEIADYRSLLEQGLVRPSRLEIWVMNADGSGKRQVTDLGVAAFAPYFHPSGERIVFSTNYPEGRFEFDLYAIGTDGSGLERITTAEGFDGFPMFSPDGRWLVFASNRHNSAPRETNIFLAEWVDAP